MCVYAYVVKNIRDNKGNKPPPPLGIIKRWWTRRRRRRKFEWCRSCSDDDGGGGSLLVLLLLLKRVCGAYHSLFLSFQLFCISRYVARLVLCCVQSLLSVDWPSRFFFFLYYYSLPNALAYYSRRHDAPIIHSCCKLPHKTFYFCIFPNILLLLVNFRS
jgi:hypothetical protein